MGITMAHAHRWNRGKLIVVDGSDGVGKGTQVALLVKRLKKDRVRVKTMDFPQYEKNFCGALIRRCLSGRFGNFLNTDPYIASILYAADRFESKTTLEKWLAEGYIVILDRYVSANQMHQGGKIKNARERKKFLAWLDTLEHKALGIPRPDLVLYLHLPVPISLKLLKERGRTHAFRKKLDLAERNRRHLEDTQKTAVQFLRKNPQWKKITCFNRKVVLSRERIHEMVYEMVKQTLN